MLRTRIERTADGVTCTGHRVWLRVQRPGEGQDGGLEVETASLADPRWRGVDHDLVALTRAATRLVTVDAHAARSFVAAAVDVAGLPPRDLHPVTGLVRVAYPLLASPPPWPLAALPETLPADLQRVFRSRTARAAAAALFPGRVTRPVVRALAGALAGPGPLDLFVLTLSVATAPLLEPDVLARTLAWRPAAGARRAALSGEERRRVTALLTDLSDRRRLRLLEAAATDADERERLRFVVARPGPLPDASVADDWRSVARRALAAPAPA